MKKVKKGNLDGVVWSVYTRYSMKYFNGVLRKLTPHQRVVIEKFGFGCLLLLDLHDIPSEFVRWVSGCVDPLCSQITVHSEHIEFSKRIVHAILGLPAEGLEITCSSMEG